MSFFDISKYHNDEYARRKLADENRLLWEEADMARCRERRDAYDREQQDRHERERLDQERENDMEYRMNLQNHVRVIIAEMEDLKLRCKFGIEQEGE